MKARTHRGTLARHVVQLRLGRSAAFVAMAWTLGLALGCDGTTGMERIVLSSRADADSAGDGPDATSDDATDPANATAPTDATVLADPDVVIDRAVPDRPLPTEAAAAAMAQPDGTSDVAASTDGSTPHGSTPDGSTSDGSPPNGSSPDGSTPLGDASAEAEATAGPATTQSILAGRSPDCLTVLADGGFGGCAGVNGCLDPVLQGGVCETVAGNSRYDPGVAESQICLQTLTDLFASACIAGSSLTPCLCGTTPSSQCLNAIVTPNGPLYPDYVEDFGVDIHVITTNFTSPSFGAGQANSILQCLQLFDCQACFGGSEAGTP